MCMHPELIYKIINEDNFSRWLIPGIILRENIYCFFCNKTIWNKQYYLDKPTLEIFSSQLSAREKLDFRKTLNELRQKNIPEKSKNWKIINGK